MGIQSSISNSAHCCKFFKTRDVGRHCSPPEWSWTKDCKQVQNHQGPVAKSRVRNVWFLFGSNLGHVWPLPKFWASRLRWYNFGHTPEIALLWAQERQNWDCRGAATLQGFDLLKDNLKFYQFVIVLSCYIVHKGCSIYWQWSLAETQRK